MVPGTPACKAWSVGKAAGDFQIGEDARIEPLGERDALRPRRFAARDAAGEDHRMLGVAEQFGRRLDRLRGRRARDRRHVALRVDRRHRLGERLLLQTGIEIDVSRPARRGIGDPAGAQNRFARGGGRGRLVVPFGVAAHQRALVARGVDPVDPGPALGRVHRPGGAEDHHRHAVAPGVEDRHGGVHQPDIGMHGGGHRLAGDFGVAVRDGDRALLVQAEQHLRPRIAEVIDQAVVQAAVAGAGVERDVGNVERAQRLGGDVAAEAGGIDAGRRRAVEAGNFGVGCARRGGAVGIGHCVIPTSSPSGRRGI